jgi:hypothetical protein
VISNNGQAVQLGLLNVFNLDANTLEEYDGANPQTLNVYGARTDASDYERVRLGYDTTDGYFLLGSDAAGTGTQRGLGFWMQGSLRWVIDSGFNLKPWSDNIKDIGTPTLRLKHLYTGAYVDTTGGAVATDIPNAGTTGTTLSKLAKVTGAPATAIVASASDTSGIVGVVVDGAGTTGSAQIARGGQASCVFDGGTTAGDYVQISSTSGGDCHDAGAGYPGIGQVIGRVLSTNTSAGTYAMLISGSEVQAPSAGAVSTVFARSGTVAAQAGDYSVGQITGAAPLASPAFTSTPTAPTPATSDNSTKIATTAYVVSDVVGLTGIDCTKSAGGTADAQINACIGAGPIANAGGLSGVQTISGPMIPASNPAGQLWLGRATYWMTSTAGPIVIPDHFQIVGLGSSSTTSDQNTVLRACNGETTGTPCAGGRYPANTPMLCFGAGGACGGYVNNAEQFHSLVKNIAIDCNGVSGCIGVQNYTAQENSGVFDAQLRNWGIHGIGLQVGDSVPPSWAASTAYAANAFIQPVTSNSHYYENTAGACTSGSTQPNPWNTSGGANSGNPDGTCAWTDQGTSIVHSSSTHSSYAHLSIINNKALACTTDALGISVIGFGLNGLPESFNQVTVNPDQCTSIPNDDIRVSGIGALLMRDIHVEKAINNGLNIGPDGVTTGVVVDGLSGSAAGYQVAISNAYASGGITLLGVTGYLGGCCDLVNDLINGYTLTHTAENNVLGVYALGPPGSGILLTSATSVPSSFGNTVSASTPPSGDNSTKVATTAWVRSQGYGTGAVSSVFGRTGAVTAANGDYSVAQVTGAASLVSPGFTGTPVAPTPSTSDNSTKIATTAYVQAQGYLTSVPTCPMWFTQPHASSTVSFSGTANKASLWGVVLSCTLATTQITYNVSTADNSANTYDLGIVNSSGTVVAHIGSTAGTTFAPSTGWKTLSWTASATLPPGKYYVAITSSCTSSCAVLEGGSSGVGLTFAGNQAESVTTGGTLPGTITTPSDAYTATTIPAWSVH